MLQQEDFVEGTLRQIPESLCHVKNPSREEDKHAQKLQLRLSRDWTREADIFSGAKEADAGRQ